MFSEEMLRLYFVAGSQDCAHLSGNASQQLLTILEHALQNGITCFQFREKGSRALSDRAAILALGKQCQVLCQAHHIPFVVNDDLDLALTLNADGLHIGQSDMAIDEVAKRLPEKMFLGVSVSNRVELLASQHQRVAYFGVGPIFQTSSKSDAAPAIGIKGFAQLKSLSDCPMVAIGGIGANDVPNLMRSGASGVAVISAITHADEVGKSVRVLRDATQVSFRNQ